MKNISGCSPGVGRLPWEQEAARSNRATRTSSAIEIHLNGATTISEAEINGCFLQPSQYEVIAFIVKIVLFIRSSLSNQ